MSGSTPTTPRDAASLVIVRERRSRPEVLMGRRPTRDRFMPDVWVFPGGRVDPEDASIPLQADLRRRDFERFLGRVSTRRARMLGVAAIRETFEETGLLLGKQEGGALRPDLASLEYLARAITPAQSNIRYHARFFLAREQHVSGALRSNGELLDLEWLPFSRASALPLVDVTQHVLAEAEHRLTGGRFRGVPLISYREGAIRLRYENAPASPHDS
ncbi:MAG: NUDIX domain-containing protein [Myxococcota bacterium]|jgi:8-oxo-dGTP pyrophosphatase MutT (NUDIX family)|nr:NUDIX domain-containing protein [Myxococcota bacterium]